MSDTRIEVELRSYKACPRDGIAQFGCIRCPLSADDDYTGKMWCEVNEQDIEPPPTEQTPEWCPLRKGAVVVVAKP